MEHRREEKVPATLARGQHSTAPQLEVHTIATPRAKMITLDDDTFGRN
ncbi:hypothetical protein KKA14_17925 [bacterium]|nr:hypothetical protein [bacterium]